MLLLYELCFFFSSRRRHTRSLCDWSSDVCSSDLLLSGFRQGLGSRRSLIVQTVGYDPTTTDVQSQVAQLKASGAKDRKSTRLNSSHTVISYAVFCLKKKK